MNFAESAAWLGAVQPVVLGEPVGAAVSGAADDEQRHDGFSFRRVRLAEDLAVWSLARAGAGVDLASGAFDRVLAGWRLELTAAAAEGVRVCGFSGAEFAFPVRASRDLTHWPLLPHRPPTVLPLLLLHPDGHTLLLAAIDAFHEQIGAVAPGRVDVGWHGNLATIPAGWSTRLAVVTAGGPTAALERWATLLDRRPRSRDADALATQPSYWTDNGASYWYRTEPGHTVTSGLVATVADLADRGVPIGAVEIDSWWYPHETLRPFDTDDWVVPPTGMLRWEGRDDVLPGGVGSLAEALGRPPLVAHARHLSAKSPYVSEVPCWVDGDRAHPSTPDLYERWLDQCVAWGVETLEHDWLVECFHGVRQLREAPGRAAAWQAGLDAAAADRGLTLLFCMATPADMATAAALPRVTSVRTSGDHGYVAGPGFLWAWFLIVNRYARALGLWPFKDVFLTSGEHAELESCLSALSAGPVGIGDPLGEAVPAVLAPCHRADGRLVKPDVPIAALDRCFHTWPSGRGRLLAGECTSTHAAGTWTYVLAINPDDRGAGAERVVDSIPLAEVGVDAPVLAWDWRAGTGTVLEPVRAPAVDLVPAVGTGVEADAALAVDHAPAVGTGVEPDAALAVDLAVHDWALWVLAPVVAGVAVVGDPRLFATAGDRRIGAVLALPEGDGVRVTVVGATGEVVELAGWTEGEGSWRRSVPLGDRGWATVEVRRGRGQNRG